MARFRQVTGAEAAAKLIQNGTNGSGRWAENAAAAAGFAKEQALKAKDKWKNGVEAAVKRDGFTKGIQNSDAGKTAETIRALGSSVHSAGLQAREGKIRAKFDKLMSEINGVATTVNALPANTPEERKQKMLKNFELMSAIKGKV